MSKTNNTKGDKKFEPTIGFWPTKSGKGFGCGITDQLIADLKANVGGRLFLQAVPEEKREDNDKLPHYRVVIFAPERRAESGGESL